eukprot:Platyproteum_vivax@DN2374_c0_g1_i1.p1
MEKYRLVPKERETAGDHEIRVSSNGRIGAYITYAGRLLGEFSKDEIVVTATGNAIPRAVSVVELLKRRIKGLHQLTTTGCREITDDFEPLEEGLDRVTSKRHVAYIEMKLTTRSDIDTKHPGYQPPLAEDMVQAFKPPPARGGGRGRGGRPRRSRGGRGGGGSGDYGGSYSPDSTNNPPAYAPRGAFRGTRGGPRGRGGRGGRGGGYGSGDRGGASPPQ